VKLNLTDIIQSRNGVPIRLTDERWAHIAEEHSEIGALRNQVLETVHAPEQVYAGNAGEFLAVSEIEPRKWMVVVYRELVDDGFVITAFLTRRVASLERRKRVWP
jgi:hypothetical protein